MTAALSVAGALSLAGEPGFVFAGFLPAQAPRTVIVVAVEPAALTRLFDDHHASLFRYLARLSGDPDLAADLWADAACLTLLPPLAEAEVLYDDAPFGVQYWVAVWGAGGH